MNVHEPIHVPVAYKCPICPKLFLTKCYLDVHEKLHKNETTCLRDICQKSHISSHKTLNECKETSRSDTCDEVFEQEVGPSRPQAMHKGERLLKPGTCLKEFRVKSSSSFHERLQKGKVPFKCKTLDAEFVQKYQSAGRQQSHLVRNRVVCHTSSERPCRESHLSARGKIHRDELTYKPGTHAIAVTDQEHLNAH
ncbi:unnamed protein product, partial [Ixodes pacificus]